MKKRSKSDVPARLVRGLERFDKFRKKHKGYRRFPDSLWTAAVKLALGLHRSEEAAGGIDGCCNPIRHDSQSEVH